MDSVPMIFVHVPTGHDVIGVVFPEFDGPFGVAFEVDSELVAVKAGDGEDFAQDLEDQRCFPEREGLFDPFFGEAIISEYFNIHDGEGCERLRQVAILGG